VPNETTRAAPQADQIQDRTKRGVGLFVFFFFFGNANRVSFCVFYFKFLLLMFFSFVFISYRGQSFVVQSRRKSLNERRKNGARIQGAPAG